LQDIKSLRKIGHGDIAAPLMKQIQYRARNQWVPQRVLLKEAVLEYRRWSTSSSVSASPAAELRDDISIVTRFLPCRYVLLRHG
jgi:hypothetical protein